MFDDKFVYVDVVCFDVILKKIKKKSVIFNFSMKWM